MNRDQVMNIYIDAQSKLLDELWTADIYDKKEAKQRLDGVLKNQLFNAEKYYLAMKTKKRNYQNL
jgi:hypothetical protein